MSGRNEPSAQPCPMCGKPVYLKIASHGEPVVTAIICDNGLCAFAVWKSECPPALWPLFLGIYANDNPTN